MSDLLVIFPVITDGFGITGTEGIVFKTVGIGCTYGIVVDHQVGGTAMTGLEGDSTIGPNLADFRIGNISPGNPA